MGVWRSLIFSEDHHKPIVLYWIFASIKHALDAGILLREAAYSVKLPPDFVMHKPAISDNTMIISLRPMKLCFRTIQKRAGKFQNFL